MSEMWAPNDCPPSSGAETINATSTIVLTALQSAGSTVPGLGVAAEIALRIIALVQNVKDNNANLVDLANDVCGLVYTLVVECRRMINNGQNIPDHIQHHIGALSENLVSIENFTKKKLKRNRLKKMMDHSKDMADIARYREMLKQSLNIYGIQSNISIQEYLQQLMEQLERQRAEMEAERRRRIEEEKCAKEEQASQAEIRRIQEEDRMANDALRAQNPEQENARLELGEQAFRQRMPSPLPQMYLAPNPYICDPYSYPAHLLLQPLYPQAQGGISLPPVVNNINSGNISNVSISNVNNNDTKPRRRKAKI